MKEDNTKCISKELENWILRYEDVYKHFSDMGKCWVEGYNVGISTSNK